MPSNYINYGPPDTDSEDDYDGFYFSEPTIKTKQPQITFVDPEEELNLAVEEGDLDKLKEQVDKLKFNVNQALKSGYTLLLAACREGHLDIVRYLIVEKSANPNKQIDSMAPLLCICDCKKQEPHIIEKIVQLLLKHGAVINVSDKYGTTPFMQACKHGYTAVVRLLIKDVSFDAVDNQGCTPIFYAIENNYVEIVKLLIKAGVNTRIPNTKGYTPRQVAQFHGFYDLLQLLPKEQEVYMVPSAFLTYNTLHDIIPRLFLKSDCPEYFQDIHAILYSIDMDKFVEYFAKERVSLADFLCMDEKHMMDKVDIPYPIFRMKILKGLLDFHLHHWSNKSIGRVSTITKDNFYQMLINTANHLQNLVIIKSTMRYLNNNITNDLLGSFTLEQLQKMQHNLKAYRSTIKEITDTTKYLASFSPPKNPLHIDYDEIIAERKRNKLKSYLKYTSLVIGVSVYFCLKYNKNIKLIF